jgi:hypothetical protein
MLKPIAVLALIGTAAAPALAQSGQSRNPAPAVQSPAGPAGSARKKVVCERINDDETGSRITTKKVCRTIEVKVEPRQQPASGGGSDTPTANAVNY